MSRTAPRPELQAEAQAGTQRLPEREAVPFTPPVLHELPPAADFDLRGLVRVLFTRSRTIAGVVGACLTIALIVVLQLTPVYSSSTLIMVGQRENKAFDPESILAGLTTDTASIENQIQVLRSSALAERVVKQLNLSLDPEFDPARRPRSWISAFNPLTWLTPAEGEEATGPSQAEIDPALLKRFASKMTVATQGRSSVIKLTFDSTDRTKAALIANAIADQYIVDQLETKFDAAKRATDWLNGRLGELATQVRAAESALENYRAENGFSDSRDGVTLAAQQLSEINGQIVLARSHLAEQEAKYRQVSALGRAGSGVDAIAAVINSQLISMLRGQQADLMRKDAELSAKYGKRHPHMIALREERRNLDGKIQEEVSRIIRNLSSEVEVARVRLNSLEGSLRDIQGTTSTQGQASIKLRELEREAQSTRTLYETFQSRFKETEAKGQVQTPDSRRLDRAPVPGAPSFPNTFLIMGLTLLGSIVLGVVIALLLERMDNGFKTGNDVERALGIANLAVVPRLSGELCVADRVVSKPLSAFSEAVRSIYTGLLLSNLDAPPQVVLVTSTVPGEGKTSLSVSLGRLAARNAQRVLLIDGDFRHPSVSTQISSSKPAFGLIDFLAGKCGLSQAVYGDPITPLQFMPVVTKPSNPAGVLGSQAMKLMIQALRPHYDLIIIDAAPVLPVSDTRMLAGLADKVLYVVQWDSTPREAVANGIKLLRDAKADIAGIILNQTDLRQHAIYGYGYSAYGYGGHYAKYYAE